MAKRRKPPPEVLSQPRPPPLLDQQMVGENLNFMVESALGALAGGVILGATICISGGVDYLEQHVTYFNKGPVYDLVKWTIDVGGSLTAGATFSLSQLLTLRKAWTKFRGSKPK